MPVKTSGPLSVDGSAVFGLFDPDERTAFMTAHATSESDIGIRFEASQLLRWIVERRSNFIYMAAGIGAFLTRLEASIKGNVAFILTERDGQALQFAFGPQIRRQIAAALSWINADTTGLAEALASLEKRVNNVCATCKPSPVQRAIGIGKSWEDRARVEPDPVKRYQYELRAQFTRSTTSEFAPGDAAVMKALSDELQAAITKLSKTVPGSSPHTMEVLPRLKTLSSNVTRIWRRAAAQQSPGYPYARARLDKNQTGRVRHDLLSVVNAARAAHSLDQTGQDAVEALALDFWKERWRLYELWLFCVVCDLLVVRADAFSTEDRLVELGDAHVGKRWTLKFSSDRKPVLRCAFGETKVDIYYQYSERGLDRANMPDIAVRDRQSERWLAIVDPKSGESFTTPQLEEVCLRYAEAFDPLVSIVANYFPEDSAVRGLPHRTPAFICHGLRPLTITALTGLVGSALDRAGLPGKTTTLVLVDSSGSMALHERTVLALLQSALLDTAALDLALTHIAFFADDWIKEAPFSAFRQDLVMPPFQGGTDHRKALTRGAAFLNASVGKCALWLIGDGEGSATWADLLDGLAGAQVRIDFTHIGPSDASEIKAICERSGGAYRRIT